MATFLDAKSFPVLDIDFYDPDKQIVLIAYFTDKNLSEKISKKIGTKIKKDEGKDEYIDDIISANKVGVRRIIESPGKSYTSTEIKILDFNHDDFKGLHAKTDDELNDLISTHEIEIPVSGTGRNSKLEKIKHIKEYCRANDI